nr:GNAT family N-acetyltransferase [Paenibacillus sp. MMS18-CY102]
MELLLQADPSEKLVKAYLAAGQCYIAEHNNAIAGAYVLLPAHSGAVELMNIAIDERLQGQGLGKQLIHHAISEAKAGGYTSFEVGTGNSSVGQLVFYQKCGFRITGVDRDFFVRNYSEPLYENGLQVMDMIRLSQSL